MALTPMGIIGFFVYYRCSPRWRIGLGMGASVAVVLVFAASREMVRNDLSRALARTFPDDRVVDLILTPLPANPFCWQVIAVGTNASEYFLNRAIVAPFPSWKSAEDCPRLRVEMGQAPLEAPPSSTDQRVRWIGRYHQRLEVLRQAARQSCGVAAWLRFARAPFVEKEGRATVVGDLRFDRLGSGAFSTMSFEQGDPCPPFVPGWDPPRSDWLK
jgi:inner membrane protein